MQKIPGEAVSVIIPEDVVKVLERIQKRHKKSKAESVRSLLWLGADLYKDLEKVGVPQFTAKVSKAKDSVVDWYSEPRVKT